MYEDCGFFRRDKLVGFNPSEKYESDWIIIPTIGENKNVPNHQPVKEIERVLIFWTWHFLKARILISWPGEQ